MAAVLFDSSKSATISELLVSYLSLGRLGSDAHSSRTTAWVLVAVWVTLLAVVALAAVYVLIACIAHFPRKAEKTENMYRTMTTEGQVSDLRPLPHIDQDEAREVESRKERVFMSVVVPAYNEVARLPIMLEEAVEVLTSWTVDGTPVTWEILVVDDGSRDETADVALKFAGEHKLDEGSLRVCKLVKNRGKGGAVTHGMQRARGDFIIFADADGASKFSDIRSLHSELIKLPGRSGIALGSRAHMVKTDAVVKRSFIRNFLMYGLHTLLYVFGIRSIGDTQCGFKLFSRAAVKAIFPYMHNEGWIFDVEVLILAERKRIPVAEVPISWHEVDGSKMELARDSIKMAVDLIAIRCSYILGIYDDGRRAGEKPARLKKEE
ncbi:nucleotide-diphospho-sugar transferase [Myxozyma melibiosi]|uniref:dolichyl-phosphate beta-glucosyltransferase n=1 Tax=Myxozyma melibiosi TaxID=54550 RepID=A0ABR1EYX9_9ASCO